MQCPNCLEDVSHIDWKPPSGIDPRLRQYVCPHCHLTWFQIVHRVPKPEQTSLDVPKGD